MIDLRTDLAMEALERSAPIDGASQEEREQNGVRVTNVRIETQEAADAVGKPTGSYVTLEWDEQSYPDDVVEAAAGELRGLISRLDADAHILVIGLGNRYVTPDSLGPRTVEKLFVTRHIGRFASELAPKGMRHVSAFCPGVLGVTGLETIEVVAGVVEQAKPDAVLCIDALCSSRSNRITSALQMNDSGLMPGAGVGNRQRGIDKASLGVPVLAIGVPTVVYVSTIAREMLESMRIGGRNAIDNAVARGLDEALLESIVTPKDIDSLVEGASRILSRTLNCALHGEHYAAVEQLCLY